MKKYIVVFPKIITLRPCKLLIPVLFLISLIFYSTVYYILFSKGPVFFKYQFFAGKYLNDAMSQDRLLDFSPLYFYIHVIAQKCFANPNGVILWMQFILASAACVLFFVLLRGFFSVVISLIGTALFLLNRSIILYSSVYEPEVFLIFFLVGFSVCVIRKSNLMAFVSGMLLGLCLLLRLNLFPLVAITPLFFRIAREKEEKVLHRFVLFIVPALFAVLCILGRNHHINGSCSPVVMNPGYLFYEGNNPCANGQTSIYPPMIDNVIDEFPNEPDQAHSIYRFFPRRLTGKQLTSSDVNAYWMEKARNFITDHPVIWLRLLSNKLLYVFHNTRWHDILPIISNDSALQKSFIPTAPFGLISAMALVGIVLSFKAWRRNSIFYAVIVCQIGVMALMYASDRQRVSIISLFIFFSMFFLQALLNKGNSLRNKIIMSLVVLALFPFLYIKNDLSNDMVYLRTQFDVAQNTMYEASLEREKGDFPGASEKNALSHAQLPYLLESRLSGLGFFGKSYSQCALDMAESLYVDKKCHSSQLDLVTLYLENGNVETAEPIVRDLILRKRRFNRTTCQSSQSYFYSARINEIQGKPNDALSNLKKALENNPGDPWVLSHLAVLTGDSLYKNRIARYFEEIDAEYFMGLAFIDNKQFENAARSLSYVLEKVPEYRNGLIYLAIAFGGMGDFARATEFYAKAMQKKREPIFCENEILHIFRQWAESNPQNTDAKIFLAMALQDFGHYDEALKILIDLHDKNPAIAINQNIEWLKKVKKSYEGS